MIDTYVPKTKEEVMELVYPLYGQVLHKEIKEFVPVKWTTKYRFLGSFNTFYKEISLSSYYLGVMNVSEWTEVVIHEFCHAIEAAKHGWTGHGPTFQMYMDRYTRDSEIRDYAMTDFCRDSLNRLSVRRYRGVRILKEYNLKAA